MKPVLDETGRLIPREDCRLSTLNCGDGDFAVACMRANLRYEKNQRREEIKSDHYTSALASFPLCCCGRVWLSRGVEGASYLTPDRTKPIVVRTAPKQDSVKRKSFDIDKGIELIDVV